MELSPLSAQFAFAYNNRKPDSKAVAIEGHSAQAKDAIISKSELNKVPGLGANAIQSLMERGIDTLDKLTKAEDSVLKKALNPVTLKQVKSYVKQNAGNEQAAKS
jgi:nucleotidyltransferase/DNA polymerase involved in DNA repair